MNRLTVVRVTLLGALAALAACADAPAGPAPHAPGVRPSFLVGDGNPPPPPADGFDGGGGGAGCVPTPGSPPCPPPPTPVLFFVTGVRTSVLVNAPSNFGFITFEPLWPDVVVSPNARVQQTGSGLTGRGTITVPIDHLTGIAGDVGVVDLSIVSGTLLPSTPTDRRVVLYARLTRPDGSEIVVTTGAQTIWYQYAQLLFLY